MKNYLFATLAFLLYTTNIFSQAEGLKEVYDDAEYFFYSESYNDALINYLKIYRRGYQTNANINFKIGFCYLHTSDKLKSLTYLEEAVKNTSIKFKEGSLKEDKAPVEAFLYLGNAYRITGNLDKAIEAYNNYLQQVPEGKPTDEVNYTKKQVEACKMAVELQKNPVQLTMEVLPNIINNSSANFNAIVTPNETVLAYVSRLRFYDAIFVSRKVKDKWSAPENITPQIQSDGNQYTCSFSADGNTMYLTKEDNYDSDIYFSKFDGKTWSKSVPLNKNINSKFWESHASVTGDGKYMYFASNRKGGKGGMDIFVSELGSNNEWGIASPINGQVNSELDDDYPFVSEDGKTLFFCSQGHKTMGGFDIFYSVKSGDSWSEPKNIGFPVNTTDDDIFFCPMSNGTVAFQSIYPKTGGLGDLDIVRYEFSKKIVQNINGSYKNILQDKAIDKILAVNAETKEIYEAKLDASESTFSISAPEGNYTIRFIGADCNEETNVFAVPAMNEGSSFVVIPELIGFSQQTTASR